VKGEGEFMSKILFIGKDDKLAREYQFKDQVSQFIQCSIDVIDETVHYDAVILSDEIEFGVQVADLEQFQVRFADAKMFYLISNTPRTSLIDNKILRCKQLGITPIPPRQSGTQIIEKIMVELYGTDVLSRAKKIVAIFGVFGQQGTTMSSHCIATKLVEMANVKVAVVNLDHFNPSNLYLKNRAATLDEIYTQINDNRSVLHAEHLLSIMYKEEERGYYYLGGNQDYTKRDFYNSDDINYLIDMLYQEFDILVLDAGSNPENNLTMQALFRADMKLLIAQQRERTNSVWKKINQDIFSRVSLQPEEFLMITNRSHPDLPLSPKTLENLLGVTEIARLPDVGIEGAFCEHDKKLLLEVRDNGKRMKINEEYEKVAQMILERFNLNIAIKQRKSEGSSWMFWNKKIKA
jgi:cellulose biosynthesis protein BcsQ